MGDLIFSDDNRMKSNDFKLKFRKCKQEIKCNILHSKIFKELNKSLVNTPKAVFMYLYI